MRDIINTKIILSGATIVAAAALLIGATYAFFSDTETSSGNVLAAGNVDLKIDNESYYNGILNPETSWTSTDLTVEKFFDFDDVKPSDYGEDTISVLVETNDAWACADVTLTSDNENNLTALEAEAGDVTPGNDGIGGGELASMINFIWWADDGDNVLETDENLLSGGPIGALGVGNTATVALADSLSSIYPESALNADGALNGEETYYIGKAWCFGTIAASPLAQSDYSGPDADNNGDQVLGDPIDGGYTCVNTTENINVAQTDSLTADISFRAVQSRHNPDFTCGQSNVTPTITPSITITPTPTPVIACSGENMIYASSSQDIDQGRRKDGLTVLPNRSDASAAYGQPQTLGASSDIGVFTGQFFSLGFPNISPTFDTASIVFGFPEPFYNGPGNDLKVYEVTGGTYPDELVKIEASENGTDWVVLSAAALRDAEVDLGSLEVANYVRLTDVSVIGGFPSDADGYDLDAIEAFCTEVQS